MSRSDAIDSLSSALSPRRGRSWGAALAVVLSLSMTACGGGGEDNSGSADESKAEGGAREASELRVASFGGTHDEIVQPLFKDFEEEYNVSIVWEPASATENLAKATATASNPEYDIIFTEDTNHYAASSQGLLAKIDPELVPNYEDLLPVAKGADDDGAGYGLIATVMFYNRDVFEKEGWDPPKAFADLFNPDFCGRAGMNHPNVTYTLHVAQQLGGGDPEDIPKGLEQLAELRDCARFEPTSPTLEEKLQLGEYAVGVHSTLRLGPISESYPIEVVIPEEGAMLGVSTVNPIKDSPNPEMAQRFINHILSPEVQAQLVEQLYYYPTNTTVDVLPEFEGVDPELVASWEKGDAELISTNRRKWAEAFDRAIAG